MDRTITFESDNGFAVRRSSTGALSFVGVSGHVLGIGLEDLKWLCHTGGPAILEADKARRKIDGD